MSTTNPKNFDERILKKQEEEMVEDIWLAVDEHCNFDYEFKRNVNEFRESNFTTARQQVDEEIEREQYVPNHLVFENRLEKSRNPNQDNSVRYTPYN